MARVRNLSALLVAVLVLSCFACASCIKATILNRTLLQDLPGEGQTVRTTLVPSDIVDVTCRTEDAIVYDDPWWLYVEYVPPVNSSAYSSARSFIGWVADYDVDCGNGGNCDVPQCPS